MLHPVKVQPYQSEIKNLTPSHWAHLRSLFKYLLFASEYKLKIYISGDSNKQSTVQYLKDM